MEAKIISVANMKGGVGKSYLTSIFANYLHNILKKKVLVIDADDTQQTVAMTREKDIESGAKENDLYQVLATDSIEAPNYIESFIGDMDYIFIDLPGNLKQKGVITCYTQTDIFIVPTSLSDEDLDSTIRFIEMLYSEIVPIRENAGLETKIYGILNKVSIRSKEYQEYQKMELPIPFFSQIVPDSDVMRRQLSTNTNTNYVSKTFHIGNLYKELDKILKHE